MLCQTLTLEIYVNPNLSLWNHGQQSPCYSCLIPALSLVVPESRCFALLDGSAVLLWFFALAPRSAEVRAMVQQGSNTVDLLRLEELCIQVVFCALVYAIKGKFAIRICRPFSQTNMFEEKKVGLSVMGFTATACCCIPTLWGKALS